MKIKQTYHDALYFAVAKINKQADFALTPIQKNIIEKMIHYEKKYPEITFKNSTIAEHLFSSELSVKDAIEDLYRKGYLSHSNVLHTNYGYLAKSRVITINWNRLQEVLDLIPTKEASKPSKSVPNEVKVETEVVRPEVKEVPLESMFGVQRTILEEIDERESMFGEQQVEEITSETKQKLIEYAFDLDVGSTRKYIIQAMIETNMITTQEQIDEQI